MSESKAVIIITEKNGMVECEGIYERESPAGQTAKALLDLIARSAKAKKSRKKEIANLS